MENIDISTISEMEFVPQSIRLPQVVMDIVRENAKIHNRTIAKELAVMIVEHTNFTNFSNGAA